MLSGFLNIKIYISNYNDFNLAIEYDGKVYHGDPVKDIKKDLLVFSRNMNLLRIREDGCSEYYKDDYRINYSFVRDIVSKYLTRDKYNFNYINRFSKRKINLIML